MTSKERITRILKHQPVDRIGLYEHFWGDTHKEWVTNQGCDPDFNKEFDFDMVEAWPINWCARMDFKAEVVAEDEDTVTLLDGNYAILRRHKKHDTTPEHIGFGIDSYEKWLELIKPLLEDEATFEKRINFEGYRNAKKYCEETQKFFMWSGVNVFECMHPVAGHEEMLAAMIYEPEWIHDMCDTFARLTVKAQQILFEREGLPDGIWYYEDMGYKGAPFMSPAMYDEFIYPAHKLTFDYAKSLNLPVIVHSCGFVEPLLDGMVRAGIDALQVIEVKAGMDLLRIYEKYGDKIALIGGIDVREVYPNDFARIDAELEKKIPIVMQKYGYVVHSDHSIPKTVNYETYKYFVKKALELGTYK
jgi:Uroporphyrinogen-III decarboxylase